MFDGTARVKTRRRATTLMLATLTIVKAGTLCGAAAIASLRRDEN